VIAMTNLFRVNPRGPRLKSLDEFELPAFVGRMERVQRRRAFAWWSMLAAVTLVGGVLGWLMF